MLYVYVRTFKSVCLYHVFYSLFTRESVSIPSSFALYFLSHQLPFKEFSWSAELDLVPGGISSLVSVAPPRSCKGVVVPSPFPSETDSEDALFGAVSSFCASGYFSTLTVPYESPVKILYPVFWIATKESRYMRRRSLWHFGSDCLPSTLQFSVCSPGFRFLIQFSSSSWVWATLSLVLWTTLTGLGRFLACVAFSLAPDPSPWLSMALMRNWPDCWSAHIYKLLSSL
jgi:hypothetical protein